jgi:hypothetical protein
MKKEKFRTFLPSVIPLDLTNMNSFHVETGFLLDNGSSYNKVERVTDLSPGGISYANLLTVIPSKDEGYVFGARIPESDALILLGATSNKIKKYMYHLRHDHHDVFINRYTLGLITISIDATTDLDSLPEYCGEEITGKTKYNELYLSAMREDLRQDRKKEKDKNVNK